MRAPLPAHPGEPLLPHDLWTAWNFDAWLWITLGLTICLYLWGTRNLWLHAGVGRGITLRRFMSFLGGMLALLVALVSPLDALGEILFSAHMTQHLVLILIAAPLLTMSDVPVALLWALPRPRAQALGYGLNGLHTLSRAWQVMSSPVAAWVLFALALWGWHAPTLYEAALRNETIHVLEHVGFLVTAILFWWVLFKQTLQKHIQYGMAIPYLFTTTLHSGVLGALMTFTSQAWYPYHAALVRPWGLTPLQDQQLAGLLMWLPGGAVFTLLTIGYFAAWLRALEQRSGNVRRHNFFSRRQELKN